MATVTLNNSNSYELQNAKGKAIISLDSEQPTQKFDPRHINREELVKAALRQDVDIDGWDWQTFAAKSIDKSVETNKNQKLTWDDVDEVTVTLGAKRGLWQSESKPEVVLSLFKSKNVLNVKRDEDPILMSEVIRALKLGQLKTITDESQGVNSNNMHLLTMIPDKYVSNARQILRERNVKDMGSRIDRLPSDKIAVAHAMLYLENNTGEPRKDVIARIEAKISTNGISVEDSIIAAKSKLKDTKEFMM